MKNKALCVIDGTNASQSLQNLLNQRCIASLPFAGRYRLIDFALSNAVHSGITNVSIFPDGNYYSLSDHIRYGKFWGLDRKVDGLFLLPPKREIRAVSNTLTFSRMREYIEYFMRSRQKYVVIYHGNIITSIAFETLVKSHMDSEADITQVYYHNQPVGIFVLSRKYLIDLILRYDISPYQTITDLVEMCEGLKINIYNHRTYTRTINSIVSYYRANLDMLNYDYGFQLFLLDRPILTKTKDESPTFYTKQADVTNSLIANGCHIEGKVENSIIFSDVIIKRGAIVKNSVLFPRTIIGENSIIQNVITDKNVHTSEGARLTGKDYAPIIIGKGQRVLGNKGIRVAQISSECVPFYKIGGLADVTCDLTKELVNQGLNVDVILPYLSSLGERYNEKLTHHFQSLVNLGDLEIPYDVYRYSKEGVNYFFISYGELSREQLYGYTDDCRRYELYCYLALDFIQKSKLTYDIIHCHDWLTGLIPFFMKNIFMTQSDHFAYTKTVFTIHNIHYQGICDLSDLDIISKLNNIPNEIMLFEKVNFMKSAIVMSDEITTVSTTYSNEICYPYFAEGLDRFIVARKDHLHGILNGVNYSYNNPETDLSIFKRYSIKNIEVKKENKIQMQRELGLTINPNIPVIGMVTRIVEQKGFDLILKIFDELMEEDIQFVLLGDGEEHYKNFFKKMVNKYPGKVSANIGFNSYNSQMIYAGSDIFLMPSRFEPCGISQMIALKYGTIPVVRETGGLKDTIIPYNEFIQHGNGFGFAHYNAHDMLFTLKRALGFYRMPHHWNLLVNSAMKQDLSWKNSTEMYINLYRQLINEKL